VNNVALTLCLTGTFLQRNLLNSGQSVKVSDTRKVK